MALSSLESASVRNGIKTWDAQRKRPVADKSCSVIPKVTQNSEQITLISYLTILQITQQPWKAHKIELPQLGVCIAFLEEVDF